MMLLTDIGSEDEAALLLKTGGRAAAQYQHAEPWRRLA
jgi:hypothetical protein